MAGMEDSGIWHSAFENTQVIYRQVQNQGTGTGVAGPSTRYYEPMGIFLTSFQAELDAIDIE